MASWEEHFRQGVIAFRNSEYEKALRKFDEAIESGGEHYNVYDSRAAALEKLGNIKQALKDSRRVIELAPEMRHGYSRSARLFLQIEKYSFALEMIRLALARVPVQYPARRRELEEFERTILQGRDAEILRNSPPKTPYFFKLPVELISEVFLFAVEADSAFPHLACHVCSHWRTIALSTPILWQRVTLSHRAPVKKLAIWVERSQNRITGLRIRNRISRLQLRDALEVCGPSFFASLKSIHCEADVVLLTSRLAKIPNVHNLNLEDIHLSSPGRQVDTVTPLGPLLPLAHMSTVRSLILDYVSVDWSIATPRLFHLRILIIRTSQKGFPGTEQLFGLLSSNPHLGKLVLDAGNGMEVEHFKRKSRISLPHLSHLELLGPMKAAVLVGRLSLPLLERFAISQSFPPADEVMDALQPFPLAITELSFRMCYFSKERLASILRTMSRLTKLEISSSMGEIDVVVDAVAGSEQVAGETRLVCPLLKHVNFSHCAMLNGGPIVRLVKPRLTESADELPRSSHSSAIAKIESILIDGCPKIDPSVPQWLRSRVGTVSCTYMTKSEARRIRQ